MEFKLKSQHSSTSYHVDLSDWSPSKLCVRVSKPPVSDMTESIWMVLYVKGHMPIINERRLCMKTVQSLIHEKFNHILLKSEWLKKLLCYILLLSLITLWENFRI